MPVADHARAALACLQLATYLRVAKVPGDARVVDCGAHGYRIAVVLKRLSVEAVAAVPKMIDDVPVEVRV